MTRFMKRIFITITLFLTLFLQGKMFSQPVMKTGGDLPEEQLTVHLSRNCLFAGEVAWFKIYCTSPLSPRIELSRMAYIELVNPGNASILRKKILLTGGEGTGEFVLPGDVPTGVYYIMAYTNLMKNAGEAKFFKSFLTVINPDEKLDLPGSDPVKEENITGDGPEKKCFTRPFGFPVSG